jgi:outer membrane receptor protein involved in Fe transport
MRQNLHFMYVQDDIRVNDKLTLNAGLRYEYASPMWEANNALTNFDPVNKVMLTGEGRIDRRSRARRSRPEQLRPAARFAYTCRPGTLSAAAGVPVTSTSTASDRPTSSASTVLRS